MINYFDAAENTLRGRGYLDSALKNLERRRERIIAHRFLLLARVIMYP